MATTGNAITSDEVLMANAYLVSNNKRFFAIQQNEGNFCVYYGPNPNNNLGFVWGAIGRSQPQSDQWQLRFQTQNATPDGELVISNGPNGSPIWSNNVNKGPANYFAVMQDDGLFCEYAGIPPATGVQSTGTGGALWSTGNDTLPGPACASAPVAYGIDLPWRTLTLAALGKVPEAGEALSTIVGYFWADDDIWGQVEDMIQEAIREQIAEQLSDLREGLESVYEDYKSKCDEFNAYLQNPNGLDGEKICSQMDTQFRTTLEQFNALVPEFLQTKYALDTVTLMVVVATMHLYLYRDGLAFGAKWGASDDDLSEWGKKIRGSAGLIKTYCDYVDSTVQSCLPPTPDADEASDRLLQWITRNSYVRSMTVNVLDARAAWPFLDPQVCPLGQTPPKLMREIYSDPFGVGPTPAVNLPDVPPWSTTTLPPQQPNPPRLTATSVDGDAMAIRGVTLAYDGVSGPRMGGTTKGVTVSPYGVAAQISAGNPVVGASVTISDDTIIRDGYAGATILSAQISGMMLVFKDGTTTGLLGQQAPDVYARTDLQYGNQIVPGLGSARYPGHALSSITAVGGGTSYDRQSGSYDQTGSVGGVVFGFRLEDCWT
jgi:hypothetical protein